jgi:hypothetical protein
MCRRSISDPAELVYSVCFAPAATPLATLVRVAGRRWMVEEAFEQAKGEVGLDHYQVRQYLAWYRHVTLAMAAHAFLAVTRATEIGGDRGDHPGRAGRAHRGRTPPPAGRAGRAATDRSGVQAGLVGVATPPSGWRPTRSLPATTHETATVGFVAISE